MVMIAAAIGGLVKWFGSRRDDGDDAGEGPGDHPIVRAMFRAMNEGDLEGLKDHIHEDCRIGINSIEVTREQNVDHGFDLWADAITDAREAFPGVKWELFDELAGEDDGKQKIAVRFVSRVTVDGDERDFEVAAFGIVEDDKLTEWHQVADQQTYDRRRTATGEEAIGN